MAGKTVQAMDFLEDVLDLGNRSSILCRFNKMDDDEREGALQALARVLKAGVVGYEYRRQNGQVRKIYLDVAIGTDWHRAPLVRKKELNRYF